MKAKRSPVLGVPSAESDRCELLAGVTFVEGSGGGWGAWDLTGWFEDHLVSAGRMTRPTVVSEDSDVVALDPRAPAARMATLSPGEVSRLIAAARARVV